MAQNFTAIGLDRGLLFLTSNIGNITYFVRLQC